MSALDTFYERNRLPGMGKGEFYALLVILPLATIILLPFILPMTALHLLRGPRPVYSARKRSP